LLCTKIAAGKKPAAIFRFAGKAAGLGKYLSFFPSGIGRLKAAQSVPEIDGCSPYAAAGSLPFDT